MKRRPTSRTALVFIFFIGLAFGGYVVLAAQNVYMAYDSLDRAEAEQAEPVTTVEIDGHKLVVPSWELFSTGHPWSLISSERRLPTAYTPRLETVAVAHAKDIVPQVDRQIAKPLQSMINAAQADGVTLVLSSAYRSATDQAKVYSWYVDKLGENQAKTYVAPAGASEHQTGLAVDIASSSTACLADSSKCDLFSPAIFWLRENAARFGFIERYPTGKQSITGVREEAWHYRYVGKTLASFLSQNDLTLDEFVTQTAQKR